MINFEQANPYIVQTDEHGSPTLFAPATETEEWGLRLNAYGFSRFVSLEPTVIGRHDIWALNMSRLTPQADALMRIAKLESSGELSEGSYYEAMDLLSEGEFESSHWADAYMDSGNNDEK